MSSQILHQETMELKGTYPTPTLLKALYKASGAIKVETVH